MLCSGANARAAARYPKDLCRAVFKGIRDQMRRDGLLKEGCYGVQVPENDAEVLRTMAGPAQGFSGKYTNDLTKQVLKDSLVGEARAKELTHFHSKGELLKVPIGRARAATGRPTITVRWVDAKKGGEQNSNYRSGLVARQLKRTTRAERRISHQRHLLKHFAQL